MPWKTIHCLLLVNITFIIRTNLIKYFSYIACELLKDYHVMLYRVYMNGSMTALINTSSGQTETECNESEWDVYHIERTTSYNSKSSCITEVLLPSFLNLLSP